MSTRRRTPSSSSPQDAAGAEPASTLDDDAILRNAVLNSAQQGMLVNWQLRKLLRLAGIATVALVLLTSLALLSLVVAFLI
jgi:hypothetical protein